MAASLPGRNPAESIVSALTLSTDFIVLDRTTSGDAWLRLTVFAPVEGKLECMQRVTSRPSSAAPMLDLFDTVRATLETRNQGRTWFVREAITMRRRTGLGTSYEALTLACRFARVIARNPMHDESRVTVAGLLERALEAWETGVRPDAIYFKSLFLLARDEGFPVRESWIRNLAEVDRTMADAILRQPAGAQVVLLSDAKRLTGALEGYLAQEHDFMFP